MTREDREIWEDLDDDERLDAYKNAVDERDALRTERDKLRRVLDRYGRTGCGCRMTTTRDHDYGCVIGDALANAEAHGRRSRTVQPLVRPSESGGAE